VSVAVAGYGAVQAVTSGGPDFRECMAQLRSCTSRSVNWGIKLVPAAVEETVSDMMVEDV
jgi:hypothetical protein